MLRKFSFIAALMAAMMLPVGATMTMLPTEAVAKKGQGKSHHGKNSHGKNSHGKNSHGKKSHGKKSHGKSHHGKGKRGHGYKHYGGGWYYGRDHRWDGGWDGYGGPCWLRTPIGWVWICE